MEITKPQVTTQIAHSRVRSGQGSGVDMSPFVHPGGLIADSTVRAAIPPEKRDPRYDDTRAALAQEPTDAEAVGT